MEITFKELGEIQQQFYMEHGKVDVYHFLKSREIVVVHAGVKLTPQVTPIKILKY